jgi:small GTP-binding protein
MERIPVPSAPSPPLAHRRGSLKKARPMKVKLLLLGSVGVGKSSLMRRWTRNEFAGEMVSTAGVDFETKEMHVQGEHVLVQIWDTAGQDRFHVITHSYYKGCDGIILVYDAENATFGNLKYWIDNIMKHAGGGPAAYIVCSKIDLIPEGKAEYSGQVISGQNIAREFGYPFFMTSAKSGFGIEESLESIVEKIVTSDATRQERRSTGTEAPKQKRCGRSLVKCKVWFCSVS